MAFEIPLNPATGRWREHVLSRTASCVAQLPVSQDSRRRNGNGRRQLRRVDGIPEEAAINGFPIRSSPAISSRSRTKDAARSPRDGGQAASECSPRSNRGMETRSSSTRRRSDTKGWKRTVVDKELQWGHAIAWADLDGDGNDELIAGVRDNQSKEHLCGVRLYSFIDDNGVIEASEPSRSRRSLGRRFDHRRSRRRRPFRHHRLRTAHAQRQNLLEHGKIRKMGGRRRRAPSVRP